MRLDYADFKDVMLRQVEDRVDPGRSLTVARVVKNNGRELESLTIRGGGETICPTVYLEDCFEHYCRGESLEQVVENCVETLHMRPPVSLGNLPEALFDYRIAREHVICRLVGREQNRAQLKNIPHVPLLDLETVFYYFDVLDNGENGVVRIDRNMFEAWEISEEELYEQALLNSRVLLGVRVADIRRNLLELLKQNDDLSEDPVDALIMQSSLEKELSASGGEPFICVLTNKYSHYGASCILLEDVMKKLLDYCRGDYYVLPSSVHEVLIVPACLGRSPEELKTMVRQVNRSDVLPGEVLSDSVYLFRKKTGRLELA